MNVLAFDTSTEFLSIAVSRDGAVVSELHSADSSRHSEALASSMSKILKECRMKPKDLDCIAVGLGPGSFTGLRVGVMTAKMLAYALGKKLVGVPSLEAIARASDFQGRRAVLMNARRGQFYACLYEKKGRVFKTLKRISLIATEDISKKEWRDHVMAGGIVFPKAVFIAEAAWPLIRKKKFADPFTLEPLYVYPRDCNAHV